MVDFRDRFDDLGARGQPGPAQTPQPGTIPTIPNITDRFDTPPQQAGAAVVLPPPSGLPGSGMPPLQPPHVVQQRDPAWPPGKVQGDGSVVQMQRPGTVPYDINDPQADNFGGDAGVWTTLKASLVPETDAANIQKKLRIYARDMGIPEERFFIDTQGNAAWIDAKGQKHLVVPTVGGGTWADPTDKMRRFAAQTGNTAGSLLGPLFGGGAAMVTGPFGGAVVAGGVDALRQIAGNWVAGEKEPWKDLSYSNMAWQAFGTGATELAGQIGSALITRLLQPGNPYNLRDGEIKQLQMMMNTARERAATAERHGIQTTPYDLTDLEFLRRLEQTVSKQPGYAGDIMKSYYDQRADFSFPNGVTNLFKQISPEGTPVVGLDKLQRGAEETVNHLRNTQVSQGTRNGWGEAIGSGARPDVREAVAEIQSRIEHTSGPVKQKLQEFLGELRDGQTLVTDFERLHNIRLDMEATLDGYRRSLPVEQRGRLTEVLGPIFMKFDQALNAAHPAYAKGTEAYVQAGQAVETIRDGILTLLAQNPSIAGNMGKTMFKADPDSLATARQLFIAAGQGDNWNAGVRAVLQGNLETSAGKRVSSNFAEKTAPFDTNRQALNQALPDDAVVKQDMNNVLDIGRAQGRVNRPPNRLETENIRLEDQRMGGTTVADTVRAALSPFRFLRTLGDEVVQRAYNANAVDMASKLTAGPRPVLQMLEETTRSPFEGWQRHAFERAVNLAGTVPTRNLLNYPDPTLPTAPDLQRGLLRTPLH